MRFCRGAYRLGVETTLVAFDDEAVVVKKRIELRWKKLSLCERRAKGLVGIGRVLEVHHDGLDLGCWVVAEVLAVSIADSIAGMRDSASAVALGRIARETLRVGKQDVESESTSAPQMVAHRTESSLDVIAGVEVVPDVEGGNYQGKAPTEPKLTKVALQKLDPIAGHAR